MKRLSCAILLLIAVPVLGSVVGCSHEATPKIDTVDVKKLPPGSGPVKMNAPGAAQTAATQ